MLSDASSLCDPPLSHRHRIQQTGTGQQLLSTPNPGIESTTTVVLEILFFAEKGMSSAEQPATSFLHGACRRLTILTLFRFCARGRKVDACLMSMLAQEVQEIASTQQRQWLVFGK